MYLEDRGNGMYEKILRIFISATISINIAICNLATKNTESSLTFAYANPAFSSVAQSCPTLYNPMDYSTSGFPVLHHLLELAQTHVH